MIHSTCLQREINNKNEFQNNTFDGVPNGEAAAGAPDAIVEKLICDTGEFWKIGVEANAAVESTRRLSLLFKLVNGI
jgi:hypothetical protein